MMKKEKEAKEGKEIIGTKEKKFFKRPKAKYQLSCGSVIYHRDKGTLFYLLLKELPICDNCPTSILEHRNCTFTIRDILGQF